jgi:hypothetical protein
MVEAESNPTTWKFTQYVRSYHKQCTAPHKPCFIVVAWSELFAAHLLTLTGALATKAMLRT